MYALRIAAVVALSFSTVLAAPAEVNKRGVSHGKATFYDTEMSQGNCGWWSTNGDHIVALNTAQYGNTDEVSHYCGRLLRVVNKQNGKVRHAVVADSCPTCEAGDLDMSKGLFADLNGGNMDEGIFPIEWSVIF